MSIRIDVSWARFLAPLAKGSYILRTEPGSLAVTGRPAGISVTSKLFPAAGGSFTVTGYASLRLRNRKLVAPAANFTVTGYGPLFRGALAQIDVSFSYLYHPRAPYKFVLAPLQEFSTTVYPADLRRTFRLKSDAGFIGASFFPAELDAKLRLPTEAVSYAFNYRDAGFLRGFAVKAEPVSLASTGAATELRIARRLMAEGGVYDALFQPVALRAGRGFTIQVDAGAFTFTGINARYAKVYILPAAAGAFTETGQPAGFRATRYLSAAPGALVYDGQSLTFRTSRKLPIATGSFAATGQEIRLRVTSSMIPATFGFFQMDGQLASLKRAYRLPVSAAPATLSGLDARLFKARRANVFPIMIGPG